MRNRDKYKDLDKYRAACKRQKTRWRARTGAYQYERRLWTNDEDKLVLAHKMTDRELGLLLKRSVGAIQSRRSKINKGVLA